MRKPLAPASHPPTPPPHPAPQLTWFTQPYVQRLRVERRSGTVEAETLTLLARPRTDRFHLGECAEADSVHPLSSFRARGRLYYVDANNFPDRALLAQLVPQAAADAAVVDAGVEAQQAAQRQQQQRQQQQRQVPPQ